MHDNLVEENTDVDLVDGGGEGCRMENNTIIQHSRHAFAGIHVTNFPDEGAGDHTGSDFSGNIVDAYQDQLALGIIVGPHPWDSNLWDSTSGSVVSNQITGSVVNLAIDGILDGSVDANSVSGAQGTYGYHCSVSSDYTAAHYNSASIQQDPSPLNLNFDSGTCGYQ